jgi:hypothetical protein
LKWTQIGNIRFAMVKPAGDSGGGCRRHPLVEAGRLFIQLNIYIIKTPSGAMQDLF